jgi:chromosome partitioning protein
MKTIAIISQKGGAGKTTLALHLAVAAEQRGLTTALFDLDPQASAARWGDKREKLQGKETPAVAASQGTRLVEMIAAAKQQGADLVIIDSAPSADSASMVAARNADIILIPCRPAAFDLEAIETTNDMAKLAKKPAYVVLNAVPPQGKIGEEARQALLDGDVAVAEPVLHQLVAFSYAVNDGRSAQELDKNSKAALEIRDLLDWILTLENMQTIQQTNGHTDKQFNTKTRKQA